MTLLQLCRGIEREPSRAAPTNFAEIFKNTRRGEKKMEIENITLAVRVKIRFL